MNTEQHTGDAPKDLAMQQVFARVAARCEIPASQEVIRQCVRHWRLVAAYNQRTNLTSISSDEDAVLLHCLDSLAAASLLVPGTAVDFGSGAGYPGIPLAIARPDVEFTLVEPRRKRVSFLRLATATLGLQNVRVLEGRLEDAAVAQFTQAVTRATFSEDETLAHVRRWLADTACLWIWRAGNLPDPYITDSRRVLRHPYTLTGQTRFIEQWIWPPARA